MTIRSNYKTSLRTRLIVALTLIVTVTSALFAYGVLFMKENLEEVIFDSMVREQLDVLLTQMDQGSYDPTALFKDWSFQTGNESVHPTLRALSPGSHHSVRIDDRYYQVEVGMLDGTPVYLSYDITEWEHLEHDLFQMLAWSIGILLLAALLMGRQASRAILAPVDALSARLAAMQPRQRNLRIASDFEGDEISRIARAFDQYMERLDQFVERERSFTAAASHELRTPLSVMLGALDVLESQQQSPAAQRAVARLRRACEEMRAFIEATLLLAREDATTILDAAPVPIARILQGLIEDSQPLLQQRNIQVSNTVPADFMLPQPPSLLQIMLGNILRNAIEHTRDGRISIALHGTTLTVQDSGTGIAAEHLPRIFERNFTTKPDGVGLGLDLVRRIADRFEWLVKVSSEPGQGTRVAIHFANS